MGKNTSVVIGEDQRRFLDSMIESGRFATASEAVRAGLSLLEEREMALAALRRAVDEGDRSADWREVDVDTWLSGRRRA
jgi:antitoxin ParD1/3/4